MSPEDNNERAGRPGGDAPPPHTEEEHLGIAGRMTRAFINSPLSPLLFMAMLDRKSVV